MNTSLAIRLAAVFGFLAVALGAFGAHKLEATLIANERVEVWHTAVLYHLVHTVVLLALATRPVVAKLPFILFSAGILIFSGSLYALALSDVKILGAITPIGGLCFLGGWLALILKPNAPAA